MALKLNPVHLLSTSEQRSAMSALTLAQIWLGSAREFSDARSARRISTRCSNVFFAFSWCCNAAVNPSAHNFNFKSFNGAVSLQEKYIHTYIYTHAHTYMYTYVFWVAAFSDWINTLIYVNYTNSYYSICYLIFIAWLGDVRVLVLTCESFFFLDIYYSLHWKCFGFMLLAFTWIELSN